MSVWTSHPWFTKLMTLPTYFGVSKSLVYTTIPISRVMQCSTDIPFRLQARPVLKISGQCTSGDSSTPACYSTSDSGITMCPIPTLQSDKLNRLSVLLLMRCNRGASLAKPNLANVLSSRRSQTGDERQVYDPSSAFLLFIAVLV